MSKSTKALLALCVVAFVAACAPKQEEPVYVEEAAVPAEPVFTGKYN